MLSTAPTRQIYKSTVCQNRKARNLQHFTHVNLQQVFHFRFADKGSISVTTWMYPRSDQYKKFSRRKKRSRALVKGRNYFNSKPVMLKFMTMCISSQLTINCSLTLMSCT